MISSSFNYCYTLDAVIISTCGNVYQLIYVVLRAYLQNALIYICIYICIVFYRYTLVVICFYLLIFSFIIYFCWPEAFSGVLFSEFLSLSYSRLIQIPLKGSSLKEPIYRSLLVITDTFIYMFKQTNHLQHEKNEMEKTARRKRTDNYIILREKYVKL